MTCCVLVHIYPLHCTPSPPPPATSTSLLPADFTVPYAYKAGRNFETLRHPSGNGKVGNSALPSGIRGLLLTSPRSRELTIRFVEKISRNFANDGETAWLWQGAYNRSVTGEWSYSASGTDPVDIETLAVSRPHRLQRFHNQENPRDSQDCAASRKAGRDPPIWNGHSGPQPACMTSAVPDREGWYSAQPELFDFCSKHGIVLWPTQPRGGRPVPAVRARPDEPYPIEHPTVRPESLDLPQETPLTNSGQIVDIASKCRMTPAQLCVGLSPRTHTPFPKPRH